MHEAPPSRALHVTSKPTAAVLAQKAAVPQPFAEEVVNGAHTSPTVAGKVFARAGAAGVVGRRATH